MILIDAPVDKILTIERIETNRMNLSRLASLGLYSGSKIILFQKNPLIIKNGGSKLYFSENIGSKIFISV